MVVPASLILLLMYLLVFVVIYVQLAAIGWLRHKRYSFQTAFLFTLLLLTYLRVLLFSMYFCYSELKDTGTFLFLSLNGLPTFLEFCIMCLLLLFYGQVKIIELVWVNL